LFIMSRLSLVHVADHSPLHSAEVRDTWGYISTYPCIIMVLCRGISTVSYSVLSECIFVASCLCNFITVQYHGFGGFKLGGQVISTVKDAVDLVLLAKEETVDRVVKLDAVEWK